MIDTVNTRSVHHILMHDQRDPSNLSLCPILDLANHHFDSDRAMTSQPIPVFRSPPGCELKSGDEVFLKYGAHSNEFLFQHYGFVCEGETERWMGVDEAFDHVVMAGRSAEGRRRIEDLLQEANYWR